MPERAKTSRTRRSGSSTSRSAASSSAGVTADQAPLAQLGNGTDSVVIAVPKGRVLKRVAERFAAAGVDPKVLLADDRTLVRRDAKTGMRFLLLKPDDVPTYVEYGAADVGVVGRDILMEREYDLYAPLDLEIGLCRMVVAGVAGHRPMSRTLRVATKFRNVAARHFLEHGQHADFIYVQSSVELAPLTGLADVIVDLVESGETLRQNGLSVLEEIAEISSVVTVNRVSLKLKREPLRRLLEDLSGAGAA